MTRSASVPAYAKINLGLRVLYRRPDGYHELRTVFQTISLADRLEISYSPARVRRVELSGTPDIADNLAGRAAQVVLEAIGRQGSVRIELKKRIPMGAGLGGGSSDAAAVLLALPVLAGKRLAMDQLLCLASELGSDVPFFLNGGTALGIGRGEELYPLDSISSRHTLVIAPDVHSSTVEAYRGVADTLTSIPLQNKIAGFQNNLWQDGVGAAENDFEPSVFARYPELRKIKSRLIQAGANRAAMTGSGSAIFGIFESAEKLREAAAVFSGGRFSQTKVFAVTFLTRAHYRSAWRRALKVHIKDDNLWPPRSVHAS